jgi:hypothetical protein
MAGLVSAAEFSADSVMTMGTKSMTIKLYVKGDKERREISGGAMGTQTFIVRPDKGVMWILMPTAKSYVEMPAPKGMTSKDMMAQIKAHSTKSPGTQKVNGYDCVKYESQAGPAGKQISWISLKLNQPIKIQSQSSRGAFSLEMKNIHEQKQPDSLFEIPADYSKMSSAMPGAGGAHVAPSGNTAAPSTATPK